MRFKKVISGFAVVAVVSACGGPKWPANQDQMVHQFDRQKPVFLELEREMTADGLWRMSPAVFTEMARNPAITPLPSDQDTKYRELLDRANTFVSVIRGDQATEFELMIENVGPRLYLPRFVHATIPVPLPECAADMDQLPCGTCSIRLERGWTLEYSWFPADPDEEARQCGLGDASTGAAMAAQ